VNPQIEPKDLKGVYLNNYYRSNNSKELGYDNYLAEQLNIEKTSSKRLDIIEKIIRPGKLLDVGCAYGFFMRVANGRGWQSIGVELSEKAADYAKNSLGLNVLCGDIETVSLSNNSFNLITLWDVIEHLSKPRSVLEKLHDILVDGGLLALTTPDIESLPAKLTGQRWLGFKSSAEHLWYFSKQTITRLLEKTGFKVEKIFYVGKYVNLGMFVDRLSRYIPPVGKLSFLLHRRRPSFYVNPYDIICVIAQRG